MTAKTEKNKQYTREDVTELLAEIERSVEAGVPTIHVMLALNSVFRQHNAKELFTEELKDRAKKLWLRIKEHNLQIIDPPLLFGENESLENFDYFVTDDVSTDDADEDEADVENGHDSTQHGEGSARKSNHATVRTA